MKTHFSFFLPLALMAASTIVGQDDILSEFPKCAYTCVKDFLQQHCPHDPTLDCFCPLYSSDSSDSLLCIVKEKDPTCDRDFIDAYATELCGTWSIQEAYTYLYDRFPTSTYTPYHSTPYYSPNDTQPESSRLSTETIIAVVFTALGLVCSIAGCMIRSHLQKNQQSIVDSGDDPSQVPESTTQPENVCPPVLHPVILPQNHTAHSPPQQPSPELGHPLADEELSTARPATVEPKEN